MKSVRKQALKLLPLQSWLPAGSALAQSLRTVERTLGLNELGESAGGIGLPATLPLPRFWRWLPVERPEGLSFAPGYHHTKGLMPWRDAVTLSATYRRSLWQDRVQLHFKPYYGQGIRPMGIWGTEASLSFHSLSADAPSWGKIRVRYDDGDAAMTGKARGYEVSGGWHFNEHLSMDVGTRARGRESQTGYAMLRWHWGGDGFAQEP